MQNDIRRLYESRKKLYLQGVDASGEQRKYYLTQALNVLNNLPDGYPEKDEMVRKINYML